MTTPEPPHGRTPGSSDRAGDEAREEPTARLDQPAAGSAAPPPADQPAAGSAAPPPGPPPPPSGRRRWSPRRRWFTAGAAVLVLLLVGAAAFGIARHREGPGDWGDRYGGPGRAAWEDDRGPGWMALDDDGPDGPGALGNFGPGRFGPGDPDDFGPGGMGPGMGPRDGGPGRHGPDGRRGGLVNTAAVTGTVVSVGDGNLVVAVDGGAQTTIPTTDRTRVRGAGNGLTGVQPGQRVVVRVGGDRTAVSVVVPVARTVGTITALDGTRATLVRPDGLTEVVDVAAANPLPKVGDRIAARGVAADNGATLRADTVRILPRAG